jgi:hypothetical protein
MNAPIKTKKPFGLSLACKIAAQALHDSVAPSSIILGNLLLLQKDTIFPKDLDTHFFSYQRKPNPNVDPKAITQNIAVLLNELKKPQLNVGEMLETLIAPNWVVKKSLPIIDPKTKPMPVKNDKMKKKPLAVKKEVAPPVVVVVKKNKLKT